MLLSNEICRKCKYYKSNVETYRTSFKGSSSTTVDYGQGDTYEILKEWCTYGDELWGVNEGSKMNHDCIYKLEQTVLGQENAKSEIKVNM